MAHVDPPHEILSLRAALERAADAGDLGTRVVPRFEHVRLVTLRKTRQHFENVSLKTLSYGLKISIPIQEITVNIIMIRDRHS